MKRKKIWNIQKEGFVNKEDLLKYFELESFENYHKVYTELNYKSAKNSYKGLNDIEKFLKVIQKAKEDNTQILIFGDYDVDGVSGAATLYKGLNYYGIPEYNLDCILPDRNIGYSIQHEYVKNYLEKPFKRLKNPTLIITVDCGINSAEEIKKIKEDFNIDVGVSDHHQVRWELSDIALFNINPNRPDTTYVYPPISGSLVALKLIEAIEGEYGLEKGTMEELEDIACLGTIADMMPLKNENFYLARDCLKRFHISENRGIRYFTEVLGNKTNPEENWFTADIIGWQIWPRINAVGRIDDPHKALYMLLSDDLEEIKDLYKKLTEINETRKELLKSKLDEIKLTSEEEEKKGIVILKPDLHEGIIGLVASRLKEQYFKPTICFTQPKGGNSIKCSGRSIPGVNLLKIVEKLGHYFHGFGGHPMAFGGGMPISNFNAFREDFYKICEEEFKNLDMTEKIPVLGEISLKSIKHPQVLNFIRSGFAPHGMKNEEPIFLIKGEVYEIRIVADKHTFLTLKNSEGELIQTKLWQEVLTHKKGDSIEMIGKLSMNYWKDTGTLEFSCIDHK